MLFAYNSGMAVMIFFKFSGYLQGTPGMVLGAKNLGVIGRGPF